MKKTILYMMISIAYLISYGQSEDKEAVMHTVTQLFLAMETNDSTLATSLFTSDARLYTVMQNENGEMQLRSSPASRLATAFGSEKMEAWREPIWNEKIEISDGLASVWVDYAFYIGDQFSHFGVDAFHLIKLEGGWKIFHLADTRRKTNCMIPEEIRAKYEN